MKLRIWPRSRTLRGLLIVLAVVVLPYAFSRAVSPLRRVSMHFSKVASERQLAQSPGDPIRVACYNIAHGRGVATSNWEGGGSEERTQRLDEIAELLREVDADIVILNEVDFESSWSGGVNQAKYLAERAGYAFRVEERNLDFRILGWTWRFGNAILSKQSIGQAEVIPLPEFERWETFLAGKKRAVRCDIAVRGQAVRVVAAHLCHRSELVRVRSAQMLSQLARDSPNPMIVVGDMNSTPTGFPMSTSDDNGDNAMDVFAESGGFRRSPATAPTDDRDLTFHSTKPQSVIDWILIPDNWEFAQYVVNSGTLSDHRLIYSDVLPTVK